MLTIFTTSSILVVWQVQKTPKLNNFLLYKFSKTLENTGFCCHVFCLIRTKYTILSLYRKIRVNENLYSRIVYTVDWKREMFNPPITAIANDTIL